MWVFNWGIFWAVVAALAVRGFVGFLWASFGPVAGFEPNVMKGLNAVCQKLEEIKQGLSK